MKVKSIEYILFSLNLVFLFRITIALPDQGQWSFTFNQQYMYDGVAKSLYEGSVVSISITCASDKAENNDITLGWMIRQTPCFDEYLSLKNQDYEAYYNCPYASVQSKKVRYLKTELTTVHCTPAVVLKPLNISFQVKETGPCAETGGYRYLGNPSKSDLSSPDNAAIETLPKAQSQKLPAALAETSRKKREESTPLVQKNAANVSITSNSSVQDSDVKKESSSKTQTSSVTNPKDVMVIDRDGVYLLVIYVSSSDNNNFTVTCDVSLKGPHGYLSAVDWPLLPFYAVMCGIYVIYAVIWLTFSALHWRELLRIQFWIGGVILLGLVEKTVFYAEYQYINSTGQAGHGGMLFAEILSCLKRTLARLLVIIVSLGFGIVKPRLGPALHRILGVGALYFILCSVEGCLRVIKPKNDTGNHMFFAEIPLAVLDSGICWWIFSALVHTTRTLKLRRNVVKLSLYRHFTNTLVFSVLASVVYMTWSLYNHKLTNCLSDWKELWVDEAYWHLLFSSLLLVIMILWRPTVNNQRYAFTALSDAVDEEEEDLLEKESTSLNDVYGTKARGPKNQSTSSAKKEQQRNNGTQQQDDDLKWVDENIPSSLSDTALPRLLDSDEEIMTVRFERNKME